MSARFRTMPCSTRWSGADQEPVVAEPGQSDPAQPVPGFVDDDHFAGMDLPPVGLPDDLVVAHGMDPAPSLVPDAAPTRCCRRRLTTLQNRLAFRMRRQGGKGKPREARSMVGHGWRIGPTLAER